MKRAILAVVLSIFLPAIAVAGDLAVKAPVLAYTAPDPCSNAGCSGFYIGAELDGAGVGVNILNLGSLSANGMWMGMTAGYQFFNGTYWLGAKVSADYSVVMPAFVSGFQNHMFTFEGVELGGNLTNMLNLAPITLPAWLGTAVPTILIGACQNGSKLSGYCAGAGAHFFIPKSRWTIDVQYLNAQYGNTTLAVGQTAATENRGTFGFSYHFGGLGGL